MREILQTLLEGRSLSESEAQAMMRAVIAGEVADVQVGAMLGALRSRLETEAELVGCARAILEHCSALSTGVDDAVDVCGTGGDGAQTFNISTTVAFVLAGGGVPVAKHGNRAVSSSCGSADVLEELGVDVHGDAEAVTRSLQTASFSFLFAPDHHQVMRNVGPLRTALGVRTTFNLLGPLMNPARVRRQVVGIFDARLLETMARALQTLGATDAMVVASQDGLDELSVSAPSTVAHLHNNKVSLFEVTPADAGVAHHPIASIRGGDARDNARIAQEVLSGIPGGPREVVVLNAALGFMVADRATSIAEGVSLARRSIDSGNAGAVLEKLREISRAAA